MSSKCLNSVIICRAQLLKRSKLVIRWLVLDGHDVLVLPLPLDDLHQELDVLDGHAEDLVLKRSICIVKLNRNYQFGWTVIYLNIIMLC